MDNCKIKIGKLGVVNFKKGYYIYVGSALNGALLTRTIRHTKVPSEKKIHWHIDSFLAAEETQIEKIFLIPSGVRLECNLAGTIKEFSDGSVKDFGSSDCNCESHLFYFTPNNSFLSILL